MTHTPYTSALASLLSMADRRFADRTAHVDLIAGAIVRRRSLTSTAAPVVPNEMFGRAMDVLPHEPGAAVTFPTEAVICG